MSEPAVSLPEAPASPPPRSPSPTRQPPPIIAPSAASPPPSSSSPPPNQLAELYGGRAPTIARLCKCHGNGLVEAGLGEHAMFMIDAHDISGRQSTGGDTFFVAVRCNAQGTRVRAKIADNGDGTYSVSFKPPSSGKYTIAISLLGEPLPGSPFACNVPTPTAAHDCCLLNGDALTRATARRNESFRISFRDALGRIAHGNLHT